MKFVWIAFLLLGFLGSNAHGNMNITCSTDSISKIDMTTLVHKVVQEWTIKRLASKDIEVASFSSHGVLTIKKVDRKTFSVDELYMSLETTTPSTLEVYTMEPAYIVVRPKRNEEGVPLPNLCEIVVASSADITISNATYDDHIIKTFDFDDLEDRLNEQLNQI